MTTQYTSILKLALPVQGELSGTWGDVVNDNITSMIEEAIAGRSVINTWTGNSHTLTTADGTTAESRAAMLEFTDTGAALTGNAEVICPTASKIYIAKNAVGSSRTVTLKTSAGTGIAIPDGTTMLLFCDGTNVVEAVTNINSLSVGGYTVTLAGAVSTAAAFSTAGANALTLTTTGTTDVTLPTTGTLATLAGTETFTNKTLTSPDINGGTIDDATIGATTATTGVFTNLTANTDLTLATGATVTGINTTTDMSDASTTTLATSDSIKQYVDAQVGANNELSEVLANGNTTGSNNIVVDAGQSITTDSILETTAAAGVDIDGVLLKDTSVGTDDASGTDIAGNNVTFRGGAGTGTGAGGSLVFQTAPASTTGSTPNTQVTALTIDSTGAVDMNVSLNVDGTVTADGLTVGNGTQQSRFYIDADEVSQLIDGNVRYDIWTGGDKTMRLDANGDISFYEDTGTTAKFFWDASAESLGIGTSSVRSGYTLDVQEATENGVNIQAGNAAADIALSVGSASTADKFVVTAGGAVGIGTTSPSSYSSASELVVDTGVGGGITVVSDSTAGGYGALYFADGTTGDEQYRGFVQYNHNNGGAVDALIIGTSGTERMRIDSSGNLLVGTTNNSPVGNNVVGIGLFPNGSAQLSRDGGTPLLLNRKTSDGTIADFRKDGTSVGSIGVDGGDIFIGTGDTALLFADGIDSVIPWNTSPTSRDALIGLGNSSNRFKDLYLSGGVYLGGTGAANKLDDYEEGTFTPTVSSGVTSPAYTSQTGSYTKIGNLVYFQFRVDLSSGTANGDHFKFGGLPFTTASISNYGGAWISYSAGFLDDLGTASWHIGPSATEIFAYQPDGSTMTGTELEAIGNVLGNVYVNGVYRV